ncbi:outer membrane lipoprotein-sorting protein [Glaciimonas immobilis]|uniref:Outer membrane lipoprotein-sorting protein n=1 Tax=Glaciimonas immobilis TaxID=728004 RepID=A0A840RZL3_9BURK|nr:outer membrane lipoprotein-sorting protein [Glaciimonas immobilis]KAF3996027.1 outer membrane lipoprotein-sorting protein [Glaciimonas immobilis]MBB5201850.1 hypothetical protein [Glaciimonas immobilis]
MKNPARLMAICSNEKGIRDREAVRIFRLSVLHTLLLPTMRIIWIAMLTIAFKAHAIAPIQQGSAAENPQVQTLTAAQIIARNGVARGGIDAWHAVTGLSEVGRMEEVQLSTMNGTHKPRSGAQLTVGKGARDRTVPFTLHMQRPHKMYLEIQYHGSTAIQVFDGMQGWMVMPTSSGAIALKYAPQTARAAATQQDLDGPLMDSAAKGTKVLLDGIELVDGRNNYRLALTLRDGQVRHLWIDADTFLDTKIDGIRMIGGTAWPVETYFSGYKKVHGLQIPHVLDTAIGGTRTTERIVIDHVMLNPVLSDALFSAPAMTSGP